MGVFIYITILHYHYHYMPGTILSTFSTLASFVLVTNIEDRCVMIIIQMTTLKLWEIKVFATRLDGGGAQVGYRESTLLITKLYCFSQQEVAEENIFKEKTVRSLEMNTFSLISKD